MVFEVRSCSTVHFLSLVWLIKPKVKLKNKIVLLIGKVVKFKLFLTSGCRVLFLKWKIKEITLKIKLTTYVHINSLVAEIKI